MAAPGPPGGVDPDVDPRADPAQVELERVVRRWQQLPLDRALLVYPLVRDMVQELADRTARVTGRPPEPVPDLGPPVVMDQLTVMVHDWRRAGLPVGLLGERLRGLRRALP